MAKLYPPYIEGVLPAFCLDANGDGEITIPFANNKAVSIADIGGMAIKVKSVQNDVLIGDFPVLTKQINFDTNEIKLTIKSSKVQFYKRDNDGEYALQNSNWEVVIQRN